MAISSTAETSPSQATRKNGQVRQPQVEREHVVGPRGPDLVVERHGLERDHEQQHQCREHVDDPLQLLTDIGVEQIDGDVSAAVGRGGDAPEDQDAEQQAPEVIGVGDLETEEIAQQDRDEDVGADDPTKNAAMSSMPSMKRSMRLRLSVSMPSATSSGTCSVSAMR
jgi:hypothetical protein